MAARRTLAQWARLKEEAERKGWSQRRIARKLGCSSGTVASGFRRVALVLEEEAEKADACAPDDACIREEETADVRLERLPSALADLPVRQARAVLVLAEGRTTADAADAAGVESRTIRRWCQDPTFEAARRDLLAEEYQRSILRMHALAREHIEHLGAAGQLARSVIDLALTALQDPVPPRDGHETAQEYQDRVARWYSTRDGVLRRALEAYRALGSAGSRLLESTHPRTEHHQVEGVDRDGLASASDAELIRIIREAADGAIEAEAVESG